MEARRQIDISNDTAFAKLLLRLHKYIKEYFNEERPSAVTRLELMRLGRKREK
jgi:hypothetical protein